MHIHIYTWYKAKVSKYQVTLKVISIFNRSSPVQAGIHKMSILSDEGKYSRECAIQHRQPLEMTKNGFHSTFISMSFRFKARWTFRFY